jgi:predicted enzyme related to lactoylglutathione lyase
MVSPHKLMAFVSTTDLNRARRFYEDVVGLSFVQQTPYACEFDSAGTMLRVTLTDSVATPGYTILGWIVENIQASMDELAARGAKFNRYDGFEQDEAGVWTTPRGDRIAWFNDPDDNNLSLTQFA